MDEAERIADEHEALIQFLYMAPVGLAQTSIDGQILMANPISAQLLMPLSRDGGLANLFTTLESVAPELRHMVQDFAPPQGLICDALRIQLRAGERGKRDPQMLSLSLVKLDEMRLMAVLSDVTLQVKRERQLKQSEAWFNAILTGVTDYAMVSLDADGRVNDWNASIARVTGFTREAVLGRAYSIFYADGAITSDRLRDRLHEADCDGWSLDEGWRLKADGAAFWGSTMIAPLSPRVDSSSANLLPVGIDPDDPAYCLVIRDITDKRDASEVQRQANFCDHLTGIANRRAFFEAAELELARRNRQLREISLIMIDIDHFKRVNDTYGHPSGDAVLRQLATSLAATFRQVDVVARLGGEEFAVLLPSTDLQSAAAVADRLRRLVESQPAIADDGTHIRYTISAGVAAMDETVSSLDALIERADRALYVAKNAGRNRIECSVHAPFSAATDSLLT